MSINAPSLVYRACLRAGVPVDQDAAEDLAFELLRLLHQERLAIIPATPTRAMIKASCKALSPGKRPTQKWVSNAKKHSLRLTQAIEAGSVL
jgi:hypothetical protein